MSCSEPLWDHRLKEPCKIWHELYIPYKLPSWIPEYSAMMTGEWNEVWDRIYFTGRAGSSFAALKISRECDSLETLLFMTRRLTHLGTCLMHCSGGCYRVSNGTFNLKGEISPRQHLQSSTNLYGLCLSLSEDARIIGMNKVKRTRKKEKRDRSKEMKLKLKRDWTHGQRGTEKEKKITTKIMVGSSVIWWRFLTAWCILCQNEGW
jgi:hypothetical protein